MSASVLRTAPIVDFSLRDLFSRMRADEPVFFTLGVLFAAAMFPTGFAALVDERNFLDVNVWDKSLKFEFALATYLLTLAFLARFLPSGTTSKRWYRIYVATAATAMVLEMIWIGGASALATASHFNDTPIGELLFKLAGVGAVILTTPAAVYALLILRNRQTGLAPAVKEAVVTGLALVLPLTLITAGTMAQLRAHQVGGTPTDAGGLMLMGWSRVAGDLRVAHFFATHAMHFVPAFGLLSLTVFGGERKIPVRLFALAYVLFVAFLFAQALNGRPFLPWLSV